MILRYGGTKLQAVVLWEGRAVQNAPTFAIKASQEMIFFSQPRKCVQSGAAMKPGEQNSAEHLTINPINSLVPP